MERIIIHSDMNSCYASIECSLNPDLKGKAVAVGGSVENRHGIILAKTPEAKRFGVTTGEAIWQAKQKCPDLIIVEPHFDVYMKYSHLAREIYRRYTDKIEPMGLDEAWCDLTGSILAFGSVEKITDEIRTAFKQELGITVSIGVSFNKIFAKLGSDLAGTDEVVSITRENFKEKLYDLPASAMMGVGGNTAKKLRGYGISTIGHIASAEVSFLKTILGVAGEEIWRFANGLDTSPVAEDSYEREIKSVGHGVTCKKNLVNDDEVWKVFLSLAQDVSKRLKQEKLEARGVQISIRDEDFLNLQCQGEVTFPTQSAFEIAKKALELFKKNYRWFRQVRALTVRAINLQAENTPYQLDFDGEYKKSEKQKKIDDTVMELRQRFGNTAVFNCCLMTEEKAPDMQGKKPPMPIK